MKYCEFCRKQLNGNENCTCAEAVQKEKKTKKLKISVAIAATIIIFTTLLVIILVGSNKLDPIEYMNVSFNGYSGNGSVNVDFDYNSLICEIIGDEPADIESNGDLEKYLVWEEKYNTYYDNITYTCTPETGLSNNDTVLVIISVSGDASKKVMVTKKEFTVTGLTEVDIVDIFKDVELEIDGVSGEATADINRMASSDMLMACEFTIEPMYNLKNGDSVVVSINNVDYLAEEFHSIPSTIQKEYMVEKLGAYVTSIEQIPKSIIEQLANEFVKEKEEYIKNESFSFFIYSEPKYYGSYLYVAKEDSMFTNTNEIRIYVNYDEYLDGKYHSTLYFPIVFTDVVVNSDGSIDLKYDEGITSTFTTDIESSINNEDSYIVTRID